MVEIKLTELIENLDMEKVDEITKDKTRGVIITIFGFLKLTNLNLNELVNIVDDLDLNIMTPSNIKISIFRPLDNITIKTTHPLPESEEYIDSELRLHNDVLQSLILDDRIKYVKSSPGFHFYLDTCKYPLDAYDGIVDTIKNSGLNYIYLFSKKRPGRMLVEHGNVLSLPTIAKSRKSKIITKE